MNDAWWPPNKIVFDLDQVLWLLPLIRDQSWPPENTTYTDPKIRMQPSKKAPFETPVQIFAELQVRLENAGQDGAMCRLHYVYDETYDSIARHWRISPEMVSIRAGKALQYICGFKRKGRYWQRW